MNIDAFEKIADADGGWSTLFRDPEGHRYIERTYPNSEMHGGGAPLFTELTEEQARSKYVIKTNPIKVSVDFHNLDPQGRVRLNTVGSLNDLAMVESLKPGTVLDLIGDEWHVLGVAEFSVVEKIWTGRFDSAERKRFD
jgi:hypothetical protein